MELQQSCWVLFLLARIVKHAGEQYNRDKSRNPFLGRGVVESQKVREIVTIVFGFISGAKCHLSATISSRYRAVYRAIVAGAAF